MVDININFSGDTVIINTANQNYNILGTGTLTANYIIASTGELFVGRTHIFYYKATVNKATYNFNILGTNLSSAQLNRESTIVAVYNGVTWDINLYINAINDNWITSSIAGTWQNIPYDDGDIINSPATTGTYTNTTGTQGANYLGQWKAYKANAANYSNSVPSARRLKYRKNLDGTVQIMGHLRKQFAVPGATTSIKLDNSLYSNTITPPAAIIMDTKVLWYYQLPTPILDLGSNLVQILPCDLYVEDTTADNNDVFSSNAKIWVGQGTLIVHNSFLSLYSADTITGLTASRNYTLSAIINASYIDL